MHGGEVEMSAAVSRDGKSRPGGEPEDGAVTQQANALHQATFAVHFQRESKTQQKKQKKQKMTNEGQNDSGTSTIFYDEKTKKRYSISSLTGEPTWLQDTHEIERLLGLFEYIYFDEMTRRRYGVSMTGESHFIDTEGF
jgi:hypothetical protein